MGEPADRAIAAPGEFLGARRLRELLEAHGIRPKKSLGQTFVVDPNTVRKVLSVASLEPGEAVVEVGPGAGSLTLGLARAASRVLAIEIDARLVALLREVLTGVDNVEVVNQDALALDWTRVEARVLVGNLPYNVAAAIVLKVLERAPQIQDLTVMTQLEVGERLAAAPGSRVYGRTSVMVAFFADARVAARISRRAFYPVPNVDSVLVTLRRRGERPRVPADVLSEVVKAAFAQRRKTLRNALASLSGSAESPAELLSACEVDPEARAEDVGIEGYVRIAQRVASTRGPSASRNTTRG